jgi:hypothetical protein
MPQFMDVHRGMVGITPELLRQAHQADLDIQDNEGMNFKQAWPDRAPASCSASPRVRAPSRYSGSTRRPGTRPTRCTRFRSRPDGIAASAPFFVVVAAGTARLLERVRLGTIPHRGVIVLASACGVGGLFERIGFGHRRITRDVVS